MRTKHKVAVTSTVIGVFASVGAYFGYLSSNVRGFYNNGDNFSTVIKRDSCVDWNKRQGNNSVAFYNVSTPITGSPANVADLNIKLRRKGITEIGFPYGSANGVDRVGKYNASVKDSARFSFLITEIETYGPNAVPSEVLFSGLRKADSLAKAQKLKRASYIGWQSQSELDSIVKYCDRIYVHCYRPSDKVDGASQYGYVASRLATIAAIAARYGKVVEIVIIYSCETEFYYTYFTAHSWDDPLVAFKNYYLTHATIQMQKQLKITGRMIFVSDIAKTIKP